MPWIKTGFIIASECPTRGENLNIGAYMIDIRTLLVDDNPEFLEAAKRFITSEEQLKIIGTALSGQEAIEKVKELNPDLVLMDLAMPDMNGLEATRHIKRQSSSPHVVILTLHDTPEYREASEAVGADGFVPKSDFGVQLLPLVKALFEGVESAVPTS
ncbi:MAG TPA: response regulator transcription factor [Anaerolineales bacterium]|nr:response regulator transcription factor [Anaerolineales bacterium]